MTYKFSNFDIKSARSKAEEEIPLIQPIFDAVKKPAVRRKFGKQLLSFSLVAILIISLIQSVLYLSSAKNASGEILGVATTAYSDLNNASKNLTEQNLVQASELFVSASNNVKIAQDRLNDYKALTWIAPQANSADHILAGAGYLARAGERLTSALNIFSELKVSSKGVETSDFEQKLSANKEALEQTRDLVYQSAAEFNQVKSIPLDYQDTLQKAKDQVGQLGMVLDKLIGLENMYLGIFGGNKTYLLIFQNYDEQRATGGFIGTFGVLKANNGTISSLNIDSIYDLDGKINELVAAPGPFQPDIKRWGIRDANWFADFPTSARKLLYFFEKGQETADGVIATTPKLFEDLLEFVGPIEMKEYGVTLTAENFQEVVQYKTSVDYDRKENEPKKMLADFAPMLLDRLKNLPQDRWLQFFQIMQNNLNQRQILVYSKEQGVEKSIEELGFSGKVLETDQDYLQIVNSNLGGTKTDLEMEQVVNLKSKILSDGSILNTLNITRKNTSGQTNRNYLRVFVPNGTELISSDGFDQANYYSSTSDGMRTDPDLAMWDEGVLRGNVFVRKESGKSQFAGWLNVGPESEKSVTLTYMLPFKLGGVHSLLLQKQAGSSPYSFEWSITGSTLNNQNYNSNNNTDNFWGFVVK
jgi:hypothetical protein